MDAYRQFRAHATDTLVLDSLRSTRVGTDPPGGAHAIAGQSWVIRKFTGTRSILAQQSLLQSLAERCGQAGEMDQLPYHLSAARALSSAASLRRRARAKLPHLLLFETRGGEPSAAVLLCEYLAGFLPSRLVVSLDFTGQRTVIAPAHLRAAVAAAAADFLLKRGALVSLVSVGGSGLADALHRCRGYNQAVLDRPIQQLWELGRDFDDTLSRLGKHTRRNFRLYLRTLGAAGEAAFVPDATVTEPEFQLLNRHCTHRVSDAVLRWRCLAAREFPDTRLAGLRAADGRWLSLAGLRSRNALTDLDWQMNLPDIQGISLVTALRAYLLRDELARGTRFLRFDGGTSHAMQSSFQVQPVSHLLLTQARLTSGLLRAIVERILTPENPLRKVIDSPMLQWLAPWSAARPDGD